MSILVALLIMSYVIVNMMGMQTTANQFSDTLLKMEQLNSAMVTFQQSLDNFGKNPTEGNLFNATRKYSDSLNKSQILNDALFANADEKRRVGFLRQKIELIKQDMKVVTEQRRTTEAMQLSTKIFGVLNDIYLLNLSLNDQSDLLSQEHNKQIVTISIIGGLILLLASIISSMIITRRIVNPIKMLNSYAQKIASGNLSIAEIRYQGEDEVGQLTQSFNLMKRNLSELIERIQANADELKQKNERIHDSIDYAKRIQESLLPDESLFSQSCQEHLLMWKPRDTVGGDFYWCKATKDGFYIAVGDCTGHGVPGALMTTLSISTLDYLVEQTKSPSPANILKELNQMIKEKLNQKTGMGLTDDGLDIGLCYFAGTTLTFAGSKIPLYIKTDNEFMILKGDRKGIGYRRTPSDHPYKDQIIVIEESMTFYMITDGYIDQNGGEKGYSFGKKLFVKTIEKAYPLPLDEQKDLFLNELQQYMGEESQRDDITMLAFKLKADIKKNEISFKDSSESQINLANRYHNLSKI
jgi:serine phosphatase RsbU (regulator of sigma subunit)